MKPTYYLVSDGGNLKILRLTDTYTWHYWNDGWNQCLIPGMGNVVAEADCVNEFNTALKLFELEVQIAA